MRRAASVAVLLALGIAGSASARPLYLPQQAARDAIYKVKEPALQPLDGMYVASTALEVGVCHRAGRAAVYCYVVETVRWQGAEWRMRHVEFVRAVSCRRLQVRSLFLGPEGTVTLPGSGSGACMSAAR